MNLATLISASAALLQACTGLVFMAIAQAPGWQRARLFGVMAFSAAGYAAVDTLFSIDAVDAGALRSLSVLNFMFAALHCCAWIIYCFGVPGRPFWGLSTGMRVVVGVAIVSAATALVPSLVLTDELLIIDVPRLGVRYRQWAMTPYGGFVAGLLVLVLVLPFGSCVRDALDGKPGALAKSIGFTFFFISALVEVLVSTGVVRFLYTADLGFLAVITVVLVESVGRVIRDAQSLDEMSQRLVREVDRRTRERDEARDALAHAERLSSLGQLAAGVGHEINNPLTAVRANLEVLRSTLRPSAMGAETGAETGAIIDEALTSADQIAKVVSDLRAYASAGGEQRARVEVPRVVRAALKVAAPQLRAVGEVEEDLAPVAAVYGDPVRLSQVLVNLLLNAAQAVDDAHREHPFIAVRARMQGPDSVIVEVEDNGVGIAETDLRRLREPYYSTRQDRGGAGLGLFVANGIVTAHGGTLEFESTLGVGTLARVTLPALVEEAFPEDTSGLTQRITDALRGGLRAPASEPPFRVQPAAQGQGQVQGERMRLLVVDDEPRVGRSIARMLSGIDVVVADGGAEALDLMARDPTIDAVLCDVMMPGISGADVYHAVETTLPELLPRLFFMTGGTTVKEVAEFLSSKGVRYLPKPFNREAVEALLKDVPRRHA